MDYGVLTTAWGFLWPKHQEILDFQDEKLHFSSTSKRKVCYYKENYSFVWVIKLCKNIVATVTVLSLECWLRKNIQQLIFLLIFFSSFFCDVFKLCILFFFLWFYSFETSLNSFASNIHLKTKDSCCNPPIHRNLAHSAPAASYPHFYQPHPWPSQ